MLETLKAAWSDLRSERAGFGFVFSGVLLFVPAIAVYVASAVVFFSRSIAATPDLASPSLAEGIGMAALYALAMLLAAPAYVLFTTGLIWISERRSAGLPFTLGDVWRGAVDLFPRVLRLYLLVWASCALVYAVYAAVFFGAMFPSASGSSGAFPSGFCLGFPLVFGLIIAASFVLTIVSAFGARRVVIAGARGTGAYRWAWGMLKGRRGQLIGFTLLLGLLGYACEMALSIVAGALFFVATIPSVASASYGSRPSAGFFVGGGLMYAVIGLGMLPYVLYAAFAWTRFYHHLVDPPPAEHAFVYGPPVVPPPAPPVVPPPPAPPRVPPAAEPDGSEEVRG